MHWKPNTFQVTPRWRYTNIISISQYYKRKDPTLSAPRTGHTRGFFLRVLRGLKRGLRSKYCEERTTNEVKSEDLNQLWLLYMDRYVRYILVDTHRIEPLDVEVPSAWGGSFQFAASFSTYCIIYELYSTYSYTLSLRLEHHPILKLY